MLPDLGIPNINVELIGLSIPKCQNTKIPVPIKIKVRKLLLQIRGESPRDKMSDAEPGDDRKLLPRTEIRAKPTLLSEICQFRTACTPATRG